MAKKKQELTEYDLKSNAEKIKHIKLILQSYPADCKHHIDKIKKQIKTMKAGSK